MSMTQANLQRLKEIAKEALHNPENLIKTENQMKKYIVRFDCCTGNLSIEKHLHSYIKERFADTIVSENAIQTIIQMITLEQEKYFLSHRGNSVTIRQSTNGMNSVKWISVGQMCLTLIPVRNEIYI